MAPKGRMALPNWMIFWKNSKRRLTPPLIFGKLYCNFFGKRLIKPFIKVQNLHYKFLDWKRIPALPLELFRKFIRSGSATLPLSKRYEKYQNQYHIENNKNIACHRDFDIDYHI